jgi:2-oxo-4-hydroxy-4-carboxy--5-ureidoimidazoline (OHCU) decarboxylase
VETVVHQVCEFMRAREGAQCRKCPDIRECHRVAQELVGIVNQARVEEEYRAAIRADPQGVLASYLDLADKLASLRRLTNAQLVELALQGFDELPFMERLILHQLYHRVHPGWEIEKQS